MRRILLILALIATGLHAEEKVALITGATRGIGLSTAQILAEKGFRVYATGRNCTSSANGNLHFEELDVTDPVSIRTTVDKIIQAEGRIDLLINNAGYALGGAVESLSMEEIAEQMDVNFFGPIRLCQAVLPQMRKQMSGRIINISSEQGVYGLPFGSLYTASKAALESLSEALSIEVSPWNIRVSLVEPGLVATRFSIKMGSLPVEGDPYRAINEGIERDLIERNEHPELLSPSQTPEEVAEFVYQVAIDPAPQLRYQTSAQSREMVSMKLSDLTGEEYSKKMREFFKN